MAETLIYMKVPNVTGESTAKEDFEGQIEVDSVRWSHKVSKDRTGDTKAPVLEFEEVTITKIFDFSSPQLLNLAKKTKNVQQARISDITLTYCDNIMNYAGDVNLVPVAKITLGQCVIKKLDLRVSGNKGTELKETLTVEYKTMRLDYHPAGKLRSARRPAQTYNASIPDGT